MFLVLLTKYLNKKILKNSFNDYLIYEKIYLFLLEKKNSIKILIYIFNLSYWVYNNKTKILLFNFKNY